MTSEGRHVNFAWDLLRSYFHESQKKRNSFLIFTLWFYIVWFIICGFFFFANKRWRKVIIRRVWLLRSTAVTMTWRQSNVTSVSQLLHLSMTSLTHKVAWTNVVYEWVYELHLSKIGSSKETVVEWKYCNRDRLYKIELCITVQITLGYNLIRLHKFIFRVRSVSCVS